MKRSGTSYVSKNKVSFHKRFIIAILKCFIVEYRWKGTGLSTIHLLFNVGRSDKNKTHKDKLKWFDIVFP